MLPASLGSRIAYDRGASAFLRSSNTFGGSWVDVDDAWITALNSENEVGAYVSYTVSSPKIWDFLSDATDQIGYAILLPEPITLRAVFATIGGSVSALPSNDFGGGEGKTAIVRMQVSEDSFNGIDGVWTALEDVTSMTTSVSGSASPPEWIAGKALDTFGVEIASKVAVGNNERQRVEGPSTMNMDTLAATGSPTGVHAVGPYTNVRAIRIMFTRISLTGAASEYRKGGYAARLHLYGEVEDSRASRQFLALWHHNLERRILPEYLDWGNVPPSSSADKKFRVRNFSPTRTAYGVTIDAKNHLWQTIPLTDQQILFSLDQLSWTPTVELGAISPNGVSQLVYVRRVTPFNATEGFKSFRVEVDVKEWI